MKVSEDAPLDSYSWLELREAIWDMTVENPRLGALVAELETRGWSCIIGTIEPRVVIQFVAIKGRTLDYS